MIIFKKLRYKNLLSTGNVFTEINLDTSQSTLIIGSNGSGKSSMLDALSFALYGRPFRDVNKNQLINSINGKQLVVELEFDVGAVTYRIVRGIKPNIFEVYQNGDMINQNADTREYQELFERNILKMNHKAFSQIVVLGSASFVPFMQLKSNHRREIIENLLDIQIFSVMNVLLKDRVSKNKMSLVESEYSIKNTNDKIKLTKHHISAVQSSAEELVQHKKDQMNNYINLVRNNIEKIAEIDTQNHQLQNLITDEESVNTNLSMLHTKQNSLERQIRDGKKELQFFEKHSECPMCKQGISHDHKQPITQSLTDTVVGCMEELHKTESEIEIMNQRLGEISGVKAEIDKNNRQIDELRIQNKINKQLVLAIKRELDQQELTSDNNPQHADELKQFSFQLDQQMAVKESLLKQKGVLDVAVLLLKDTGIKTKIIKQYIPIINKLINKYLAAMDFFVNFELNENFEETIKSRFRDEFTYASFSEGEKTRLDLALLFAWRALAKLRNSVNTNLLIFDEILDSSLDSNGLDEFLKIIAGLSEDSNVFIISHREAAADKFTNVLKFEKIRNFSRIV